MNTQPLLDLAPRRMSDTSLDAYDHVCLTLSQRERDVFLLLHDYLDSTGHADVTGGELADKFGIDKTSIRPRLTGLQRKGWVQICGRRNSRVRELPCHPYAPVLPRAAVERANKLAGDK